MEMRKSSRPGAARAAELQAIMRQRLARLRGEVHGALHADGAAEAGLRTAIEDAAGRELAEVDAAQVERDGAEIREIEAALARIDDGRYGDCERCGQPIPDARLGVEPEARMCITCARAAEVDGDPPTL